MVPNAAMGGNQAIESIALLLNEFGKALKISSDGKIPGNVLKVSLTRYSEQRQVRTTEVQKRAGIICRAQLRYDGQAAAVFQELPALTDADWLFRGFMGFSGAPVLDNIPLSIRGNFYNEALASFWQRFKTRKYSNSELFGLV